MCRCRSTIVLLGGLAACGGEAPEPDADQDGYTVADGDCDDADPAVFPGADEVCNDVDDDCDGAVDDDAIDASTWYTDADGDGFGDPSDPVIACASGPQRVGDDTDCDDGASEVHPGATEIRCTHRSESCGAVADADVWVPTDHPTLQEAVDAVADGAVICAEVGQYDPVVITHPVTLASFPGPSGAFIDGGGAARPVTLQGAPGAVLRGFTLINGVVGDGGGGLWIDASPDAEVIDCVLEGNNGAWIGGGAWVSASDGLRVAGCTFSGNGALIAGGMALEDSDNVSIEDCTFSGNGALAGGGMTASESVALTVTDSHFTANEAETAGGLALDLDVEAVVSASTFSDNTAGLSGGALFIEDAASVSIQGCTITGNVAQGADGGGIYVADSVLSVSDSTIADNTAATLGGGLALWEDTVASIEATIERNTAEYGGGVGALEITSLELASSTLADNDALSGGAVFGRTIEVLALSDSALLGNRALEPGLGSGGGIYAEDLLSVSLDGVSLLGNSGEYVGGGATLVALGSLDVIDAQIEGNTADYGGGLHVASALQITVAGGAITGNDAALDGGGLFCAFSPIDLQASHIYGNTPNDVVCNGCMGCPMP